MDREWRESIDMRSSLVGVGLVVVSAALLRCWNIRQGFVAPSETEIVTPVLQLIRTGSYRPHALSQPTLAIYLQTGVAILHFLWGALRGVWRSVDDFGPGEIVAWGRGFSALVGTATTLLVYQIGMRWGARHALLAAGLMAVTPTDVAASREVGGGTLVTFLSALALLLSLATIERGGLKRLAAAGAAAGLAAAAHYAGAVILVPPLLAAWTTTADDRSRGVRATIVVAAACLAFVVATPLAVRDLPVFLNGVAIAAAPSGAGVAGNVDLLQQLVWAMQWPGIILAFAGISLGIVRAVTGPGHTRWMLLVSFPIVYFVLVAWHGATSDRVLLPLLPAATVLAAIAVVSGVSLLRQFAIPREVRTALIAALTVVAVLPPAVFSIEIVRQAGRTSSVVRARPGINVSSLGVEAPARQGARSAHTGRMQATSNAARRDASAARMAQLFPDGPLVDNR